MNQLGLSQELGISTDVGDEEVTRLYIHWVSDIRTFLWNGSGLYYPEC